jgi:hypothetical protein
MAQKHEVRRLDRRAEITDKIRKLQGRQESGLLADSVRGPSSPLGGRKKEEPTGRR